MTRLLQIAALLIGLIFIGVASAMLLVEEQTLKSTLVKIPGVETQAPVIIETRHTINTKIEYFVDDLVFDIKSLGRMFSSEKDYGNRQVVSLKLTPPPKSMTATPPATASEPVINMQETGAPVRLETSDTPIMEETDVLEEAIPLEEAMPVEEVKSNTESTMPAREPEPIAAPPEPMAVPPEPMPMAPAPEPMKTAPAKTAAAPEAAPEQVASLPDKGSPDGVTEHKKGLLYYKGIEVPLDYKLAIDWFRKAAVKGHKGSQYNLGIMYYMGRGVPKSLDVAAKWFLAASEKNHAAAQYNLGFMYYGGEGVEKDIRQAYKWIDRAAQLGDEKALAARDSLMKTHPKELGQ